MKEDPTHHIEALLEENAELRERLEAIEARDAAARRTGGWLAKLGFRLFIGENLRSAFRALMTAQWQPFPRNEVADVLSALARRMIRVSTVGLVVAVLATALPAGLVVWQNFEIRKQSALFREQLDQQTSDTRIVRRAQLLATIYDCADPEENPREMEQAEDAVPESDRKPCQPKAHPRAREEAVRAFIEIERVQEARIQLGGGVLSRLDLRNVNLSEADLRGVDLSLATLTKANLFFSDLIGANLSGADLRNANLRAASFQKAILRGASLSKADLRGAFFKRADLSGAVLNGASMYRTDLTWANLTNASLRQVDLSRAFLTSADLDSADLNDAILTDTYVHNTDLSNARNLLQSQINQAIGDSETILPPGLKRPKHWPEDFGFPWSSQEPDPHSPSLKRPNTAEN